LSKRRRIPGMLKRSKTIVRSRAGKTWMAEREKNTKRKTYINDRKER